MSGAIQAIETRYNGYRFRSRLEARWAVFFDTLGVRYEYEREGFALPDDLWYLPDFWLPDYGVFCEVKGERPSRDESYKHIMLAVVSDRPVIVTRGEVGNRVYSVHDTKKRAFDGLWQEELTECFLCKSLGYLRYPLVSDAEAIQCANGNGPPEKQQMVNLIREKGFPFRCFNNTCPKASHFIRVAASTGLEHGGPRLAAAKLAARQARFEHGESGDAS